MQDGSASRRCGALRDGEHVRAPAIATRPAAALHGQIDAFAVYCQETSGVYLIPIGDVLSHATAYLRVEAPRNGQRERIRFASDYEIARVCSSSGNGQGRKPAV